MKKVLVIFMILLLVSSCDRNKEIIDKDLSETVEDDRDDKEVEVEEEENDFIEEVTNEPVAEEIVDENSDIEVTEEEFQTESDLTYEEWLDMAMEELIVDEVARFGEVFWVDGIDILYYVNEEDSFFYSWEVGDILPKAIYQGDETTYILEISVDSKYALLESSTSVVGYIEIINTSQGEVVQSFDMASNAFFSYDGKYAVITVFNDKEHGLDIEVETTTDVMLCDLSNGEVIEAAWGETTWFASANKWDEEGLSIGLYYMATETEGDMNFNFLITNEDIKARDFSEICYRVIIEEEEEEEEEEEYGMVYDVLDESEIRGGDEIYYSEDGSWYVYINVNNDMYYVKNNEEKWIQKTDESDYLEGVSPNGKYFIMDSGTSTTRSKTIYTTDGFDYLMYMGAVTGEIIWLPDGDWFVCQAGTEIYSEAMYGDGDAICVVLGNPVYDVTRIVTACDEKHDAAISSVTEEGINTFYYAVDEEDDYSERFFYSYDDLIQLFESFEEYNYLRTVE